MLGGMKKIILVASAMAASTAVVALAQIQNAQPAPASSVWSSPATGLGSGGPQKAQLPPFSSPAAMQAEFVRRFESSPGFGVSRVGLPQFLAPAPSLVLNDATYRVVPPTLLGLEDEPMAYVLATQLSHRFFTTRTNLTRREIRKMFTHRPLTLLESNAVVALQNGHDLVVLTNQIRGPEAEFNRLLTPPDLLVVGALRAKTDCAACHQCKENTLLGAFAYSLSPLPPPLDPGTNAPSNASNLISQALLDLHGTRSSAVAPWKL